MANMKVLIKLLEHLQKGDHVVVLVKGDVSCIPLVILNKCIVVELTKESGVVERLRPRLPQKPWFRRGV